MSAHTSSEARILPFAGSTPTAAPPSTTITAGDVIREYLADLKQQRDAGDVTPDHYANVERSLGHAPRTARAPEGRYVGLSDWIGAKPVAELKQHDLTQWLRANPAWKSNETKLRNLSAALACFHWAHETAELIDRCPYRRSRKEKLRRVERRDATDEEFAAICAGAPEHLRRFIVFMDATGTRTCEARELVWTDVAWEDRVAVLEEHKTVDQLTESEPRLIGLPPDFLRELNGWRQERRESRVDLAGRDGGRILVNSRGQPWTRRALCAAFRRLRRKLQLPGDLTLYCLRHRYGTQASLSGASDREIADQMGHKDTRTTKRYTHTQKRAHIGRKAEEIARRRQRKQAPPEIQGELFT